MAPRKGPKGRRKGPKVPGKSPNLGSGSRKGHKRPEKVLKVQKRSYLRSSSHFTCRHRGGNISKADNMPGKMLSCPHCSKVMRSDNLKNHIKRHGDVQYATSYQPQPGLKRPTSRPIYYLYTVYLP